MYTATEIPPKAPLAVSTCVIWLLGSFSVILLSFLLQIGSGRAVVIPVINQTIPETCTLYSRFGVDCPGCGLTRSFIHLSHGRVSAAWQLNAVGVFLYAYVLLQIGLASYHLFVATRAIRGREWASRLTAVNQAILITLAVALFGQWLFSFVS